MKCIKCGRSPQYISSCKNNDEEMTPEQYARSDGTYNPIYDAFVCDECYIKMGCPTNNQIWGGYKEC